MSEELIPTGHTALSTLRNAHFDTLIESVERDIFELCKRTISQIEDTLIAEYSASRDLDATKRRFELLSSDVGRLLEVLPREIHNRLAHFRYWLHRTNQFELMGEWTNTGSRSARVWVFARNIVSEALAYECAAMLGLFGEILVAHAFTNVPAVQVAELPSKGNTMFVIYYGECCYARAIELSEKTLTSLVEYYGLVADLADEHRARARDERKRNAETLMRARDEARNA